MKTRFILYFILLLEMAFITACRKESTEPVPASITIMEYGNPVDINLDTLYLSSDYTFFGKAQIGSPDLIKVRYIVLYDDTEITSTSYTPETGGTGFLVDSILFDINYSLMAPAFNHVTLRVEATESNGTVTKGHVTFRLQPLNYPFQFRFYDFNSSDTLSPGATATILPFYSPLTVDDQISSVKVYRKTGFGTEEFVDSFGAGDFYYYQTGYLREYAYQVPSLPPGSSIVHRFELLSTKNRTHVIQHTIKVQ